MVKPAAILEDLRRRDFTANAMALSLNEGSYGLLMDPLNGVADIENRELRLVSNYGFIEDPVRMVRAARLSARLGWQMEERTLARYETGKAEEYISAMGEFQRGYELEEIVHEEDPLRVLTRLESEGWMKVLCASWTPAKANIVELEKLREAQAQLQMQGIQADPSAAQFPLLTARMAPKDIAALKQAFPRPGFVAEIDALETEAKQFAAELGSKQAASPSGAWKTIFSAPAGGGPVGGLLDALGCAAGEVSFLLYGMADRPTAHPVRADAGDADRAGACGIRRTGGPALFRTDGWTAGHARGDEGVPRALLAARPSTSHQSAARARGKDSAAREG